MSTYSLQIYNFLLDFFPFSGLIPKMPFYDGIGVIAEKHAVVLDIGSAFTKVGYAGESSPRAIIRTPPNLETLDKDSLGDALVEFVHKLYFEILLVNPKDRRVVLLESLLGKYLVCFSITDISLHKITIL